MSFYGITVNFIIQKLESKHLVCLSILWWQVFLRERENILYIYSGSIIVVKYSCWNRNTVVWYEAVVEDLAKHISWAKTGSCSKFCTLRRKLFFFFSSAALLLRGFIDSTKGLLVDSQSIRPKTCSCCCC